MWAPSSHPPPPPRAVSRGRLRRGRARAAGAVLMLPRQRQRQVSCCGALAVVLLLGVLLPGAHPGAAADTPSSDPPGPNAPPVELTQSVTPLPSSATRLGPSPAAATVTFHVALRLRHVRELRARIARGEVVSRREMARRHLPLPSAHRSVEAWVTAQGLRVVASFSHRLALVVEGSVAAASSALGLQFERVAVGGSEFHAASAAPRVPSHVGRLIVGINGLQPYLKARRLSTRRHADAAPAAPHSPPYLVADILGAYGASALNVTGNNSKTAIVINTFPRPADLTKFWAATGVPQSLRNLELVAVHGSPNGTLSGEESLDVQWSSGIASGSKVRVYGTGDLRFSSLDLGFLAIISDLLDGSQPQLQQLSISLDACEQETPLSQITADSYYFAVIAAHGVSIFVSSGDEAAFECGLSNGPAVSYFAADPSVTAVGGTTLTLSSSGAVAAETAWYWSGGGSSSVFPRPSWQQGVGVPAGSMRLLPDVALNADPYTGVLVYVDGSAQQYGGTSASAPVWAGFAALLNEARAKAGHGPLGFVNSKVYPLLGTPSFRDVTKGNNGWYSATPGYDLVTGVGTPLVNTLLRTLLSRAPAVSRVIPSAGAVGRAVAIMGANLDTTYSVAFNGTKASTLRIINSTLVTTSVPPGATSGRIQVTTVYGTASSATVFTVRPTPVISSFSPASGQPGTNVTILGLNFVGATAVNFNGTSANFSTLSNTRITATVPAGAATGSIAVVGAYATGNSSGVFVVLPQITSFSPTSGKPQTLVAILGSSFSRNVTFVGFNGAKAHFFVSSNTRIVAAVPQNATSGLISVRNKDGTATSATIFTVA